MGKARKILIIGNGGSCLQRRIGHLIDRFDGDIARFNEYQITGYEQFVGTRTDVHITHSKLKVETVKKPERFVITAKYKRKVKKELKMKDPTTGLLAVKCYVDKGYEVFIHGFDHYDSDILTHYFGPGVSGTHNGVVERAYFRKLFESGKIKQFGTFSDPVITVVMPFHNEGDEPQRTLHSLFENTPENSFNVIAIDDKSDRARNGALKSFPRVMVIRNLVRRGVDTSRTIGAYHATTKYIIFIDAHMRFSPGWLDAYIRELEKDDKNVVYCKSENIRYDYDTPVVNTSTVQKHGCDFSLLKDGKVFWIKWITDKPKQAVSETRGLMGANYAMTRDFFVTMRGLEGLREYGMSEEFLALKTLWFGGKIIYIDDVVISHLYRNFPVYRTDKTNYYYNKLFIIRTLFTIKFGDMLISHLEDSAQLGVAIGQIKSNRKVIAEMKTLFNKEKKYTFKRFVNKYEL